MFEEKDREKAASERAHGSAAKWHIGKRGGHVTRKLSRSRVAGKKGGDRAGWPQLPKKESRTPA